MKEIASLQHYFQERQSRDEPGVRYPFVTISRQAGAGAHTLANELMTQMHEKPFTDRFAGWKVFDITTYEGLAQHPELQATLQSIAREEYHSEFSDLLFESISKLPQQFVVYKKLFAIMRSLACIGKVILIGRAGSCVTRGIPGGIHVRLVAPEAIRIERTMKQDAIDKATAAGLVRERDRERAKLVQDFFSRDIENPLLYDVVWNTHTMHLEDIASSIRRMIFRNIQNTAANP